MHLGKHTSQTRSGEERVAHSHRDGRAPSAGLETALCGGRTGLPAARAYRASDGFNDRPFTNLQMPMKRWQGSVIGHFDVTDNVTARVEYRYTD